MDLGPNITHLIAIAIVVGGLLVFFWVAVRG